MGDRAGPCWCIGRPCAAGAGVAASIVCSTASAAEGAALGPGDAAVVLLAAMLALVGAGAAVLVVWAQHRLREAEAARRVEAEVRERAERDALTDPVTGLLNRRGLAASFARRRQPLAERDLVVTLLAFEPDRLAQVREIDGPEVADALLSRLARVLPAVLRDEDDAGRLDGERFLLLFSAPRYAHPCERVARRLQDAVAAAPGLRWLGEPMTLRVGIAQVTSVDTCFARALAEAESALRAARQDTDGRVVVFHAALARAQARRSGIAHAAADALGAGGIGVAYQPIVAVEDRKVVAVEALPRIRRVGGAGALRLAAEDPHLAGRLALRALDIAVADAGRLRRQGLEAGRLSLNLAEAQLADPGFSESLLDQLMLEGLSANDLMLEVGERIFLSRRLPRILETLERLTAAGAECAVDAFGTGYATVAQLRRAPLGWIKLEPALVNEIAADPAAREVAAAALAMARAIGCRAVAEGVETAAVAAAVADLGFDCAQGAHYCAPVSFAEVETIATRGVAA